jgi:pyrroline-5-carboxylate reductase
MIMNTQKIAFIGGGNMATSLIGGLISNGFDAANIHVSDPATETLNRLKNDFSVITFTDNLDAISQCGIVVLAVKPQQLQSVLKQLRSAWNNQLLISIAAGIRIEDMQRWLDDANAAIVRVMPNTPSLVQAGASAMFANANVSVEQQTQTEEILAAVGLAVWVDEESKMDAVTALSGSGPAYFFLVMEAMEFAAKELGLSDKIAQQLCQQTAFGAAKMALASEESPATLRQRVTSPGGTTERALHELEDGDLKGLFENALVAAALRSRELAHQLGQDDAE